MAPNQSCKMTPELKWRETRSTAAVQLSAFQLTLPGNCFAFDKTCSCSTCPGCPWNYCPHFCVILQKCSNYIMLFRILLFLQRVAGSMKHLLLGVLKASWWWLMLKQDDPFHVNQASVVDSATNQQKFKYTVCCVFICLQHRLNPVAIFCKKNWNDSRLPCSPKTPQLPQKGIGALR